MRDLFERDGYLNPILLQIVGMAMLVIFSVLYFIVGKESSLLVGAALALIGIGSAGGALVTVRQETVKRAEEHLEAVKEEMIRK